MTDDERARLTDAEPPPAPPAPTPAPLVCVWCDATRPRAVLTTLWTAIGMCASCRAIYLQMGGRL